MEVYFTKLRGKKKIDCFLSKLRKFVKVQGLSVIFKENHLRAMAIILFSSYLEYGHPFHSLFIPAISALRKILSTYEKKGFLTIEHLRDFFLELGLEYSDDELQDKMDEADRDGKTTLNLHTAEKKSFPLRISSESNFFFFNFFDHIY